MAVIQRLVAAVIQRLVATLECDEQGRQVLSRHRAFDNAPRLGPIDGHVPAADQNPPAGVPSATMRRSQG
jgi:hypothetical protein